MRVLFVTANNFKNFKYEINLPFLAELSKEIQRKGNEFELFLFQGKGLTGYLKNVLPLRRYIKENKIDIIHAFYGLSSLVALFQKKLPVVTTFLGSDIEIKKQNFLSSISCYLSDYSVFVSKSLYEKSFIKPKTNYKILPFGVDFSTFYPVNKSEAKNLLGLDLRKNYILFSGSFDNKVKNYSLAQKATKYIQNTEIIELKNYSRKDVNLLLNASELLLLTSFWEGSPQVVKEAMAANCPVVATNVGDNADILKDAGNSFVTDFDSKEISDKVDFIIKDGGRSDGRNRISRLSLEVVAEEYIKIYNECLKNF